MVYQQSVGLTDQYFMYLLFVVNTLPDLETMTIHLPLIDLKQFFVC